ncbi:hypothetical protein NXX53_06080 [Bacteroides salyersiae]|nr:hypothetical protein [Bacteroides salyersiae]
MMETAERNKFITGVFTYLMRAAISKDFSFPGGGLALRTVNNCLDEPATTLLAGGLALSA